MNLSIFIFNSLIILLISVIEVNLYLKQSLEINLISTGIFLNFKTLEIANL